MTEICVESASALARRIAAREVSAVAVLAAQLAQIVRVNPALNTLVQSDAAWVEGTLSGWQPPGIRAVATQTAAASRR
jgi:Asp-tRNA(Asn)/Glu-tRNA(Gln) amidotransferase A subunit family amidase